ncbi:hypothetical protein V1515DRAFT_585442 [Lipomyces mesembrius]
MAPNIVPGLPEPVTLGNDKLSITCPACGQIIASVKDTPSDHEHRSSMRVRLVSHAKVKARNNDAAHQPGETPSSRRKRKDSRKRQQAIESVVIAREDAVKASNTDEYWQRYLPGSTKAAIRIVQGWLTNCYTDVDDIPPAPESVLKPPTTSWENPLVLLENSIFTPLASLPFKERRHYEAVAVGWNIRAVRPECKLNVSKRLVWTKRNNNMIENVCQIPDVKTSLATHWRDASKRIDNERYATDAMPLLNMSSTTQSIKRTRRLL